MEASVLLPDSKSLPLAAGASPSTYVHLGPYRYMALVVPATWPADTDVIFLACNSKDGSFGIHCGETGTPARISGITPGELRSYALPEAMRRAPAFVKVQAVAAGTVAAQVLAAAQSLEIAFR